MAAQDMKTKLQDAIKAGSVSLGSGTVDGNAPVVAQEVTGPTTAQVPKVADQDPLVQPGNSAASQGLAEPAKDPDEPFKDEIVIVTEEEREAFLLALVTGNRYMRPFSLFNGKVTGMLRCRSLQESEAIVSYLNLEVQENRYKSIPEYNVGVRNSTLAAQVEILNGVTFGTLVAPLTRTQSEGKVTEPGWLADRDLWSTRPEPVVAALYEEVRKFERKYWTMVAHAGDQNFWQPAGSTSV